MRIIRKIFSFGNYAMFRINRRKIVPKFILIASLSGFGGFLLNHYKSYAMDRVLNALPVMTVMAETKQPDKTELMNIVSQVVELINPAIVQIDTDEDILPFRGTGFVVDVNGYIITNAHIFNETGKAQIMLYTNQYVPGEVVAMDRASDLALIKFDPGDVKIKALRFSDSSNLRLGEFVMSVGVLKNVSVGVVSALDQVLKNVNGLTYIQTDAITEPGCSGSPLVNLRGDVVGVSSYERLSGFGYSIPGNHCRDFIDLALERKKRITVSSDSKKPQKPKGRDLGVVIGALTNQIISDVSHLHRGYLVTTNSGLIIHSLFEMSPAHRIGIFPGDIVESINGTQLHSTKDFNELVSRLDSFDMEIIRRGKKVQLKNVTPEYY